MKNFMFNSNAKKKISITSALFSLLILFFALNCSFCGNLCSASLTNDNDKFKSTITDKFADNGTFNNSESSRGEEETTAEIEHKVEDVDSKEKDEEEDKTESTEAPESKRGDLCPFSCLLV